MKCARCGEEITSNSVWKNIPTGDNMLYEGKMCEPCAMFCLETFLNGESHNGDHQVEAKAMLNLLSELRKENK